MEWVVLFFGSKVVVIFEEVIVSVIFFCFCILVSSSLVKNVFFVLLGVLRKNILLFC